ncbi:MAG: beta-hydroxyacyl-ACP dehydratase [Deltaproteobacteria bacterium]|jgi:3-hydroxymyristoyl/3-hydroxydecanoyl-(acyl carrier protein) dehydratase|nr:beta-hydroxyacyl-ACP dehydratase [Deltaproteobacteria bacterium]MBW2536580.1 beta-hydroxyacyl-ACP dehydratase [Deltaproteobacteria bacterium]
MAFEQIIKRARRKPLYQPTDTTRQVEIGRAEIERLLPHRDPMLFVDRISAIDLEQETMLAHRRIDPADPLLTGHFPGYPVYPGALLVETMGQACLCLHQLCARGRAEVLPDDAPDPLRLLRVHHALFQAEALPGDELELLGKRLEHDDYTVVCAGQVRKGDAICAMAVMEVYLVDPDEG